jgi:hypothetical protein
MAGSFGTREFPVILDITQRVQRIAWRVGTDILLVRLTAQIRQPALPTVRVISNGAYNGDGFVNSIDVHDDKQPAPVIVFPKLSADMRAHTLVFNRPPIQKFNVGETFNVFTGLIIFNIRRIKSFNGFVDNSYQLQFTFPPSHVTHSTGLSHYAFTTFGLLNDWEIAKAFPFTTGVIIDAEGHTALSGNIRLFGTTTERGLFLSRNGEWFSHDEPSTDDIADLFGWEMEAWSFQVRTEFPVNAQYRPTFGTHGVGNDGQPTLIDEAKGHGFDHDHATVDHPLAEKTVTINLNTKSMSFTMVKT